MCLSGCEPIYVSIRGYVLFRLSFFVFGDRGCGRRVWMLGLSLFFFGALSYPLLTLLLSIWGKILHSETGETFLKPGSNLPSTLVLVGGLAICLSTIYLSILGR